MRLGAVPTDLTEMSPIYVTICNGKSSFVTRTSPKYLDGYFLWLIFQKIQIRLPEDIGEVSLCHWEAPLMFSDTMINC